MMKRTAICVSLFALMILSGCDRDEPENRNTYQVDEQTGTIVNSIEQSSSGTVTLRSGPDMPSSLPTGFTLYPGARVTNNAVVEAPGRVVTTTEMQSSDMPGKLADHYAGEAAAAGIGPLVRFSSDAGYLVSGAANGREFAFTAARENVVVAEPEDNGEPPATEGPKITRATLTITR